MDAGRRSETTLRFVLVGLAVTGALLVLGESLWYAVRLDHVQASVRACTAAPPGDATLRCLLPLDRDRVAWSLGVAAAALVVVAGCAATGSWWRARHLVALPRLPATGGGGDVVLLRRPGRPVAAARADGIRRRYVEVGTNWMAWAVTDPSRARAVLRHELAHHEARDVLPTRLTWWSGPVVAALAATVLALESSLGPAALAWAALRVALVLLVVGLARAAALRVREYDADLVAARDDPDALARALTAGGRTATRHRAGPLSLLRTHPTAAERLRRVTERRPPTEVPADVPVVDAVVVGLVATAAGPSVSRLWGAWAATGDAAYWSGLVGWGLAGLLVGGWTAVVLARPDREGRGPTRVRSFAWILSGALVVGSLVLDGSLVGARAPVPDLLPAAAMLAVVPVLVTVVRWLHDLARLTDGGGRGTRRSVVAGGAAVFALVLGIVGSVIALAGSLGVIDRSVAVAFLGPTVLTVLLSGPVLVAVVLGVAVTLVVGVRRRPDVTRRAALVGVPAGGLGVGLLVVVTVALRHRATAGTVDPLLFAGLSLASLVVPVVVGGLVAARGAPGLPLVRAAVAAVTGALVGTVGALVVLTVAGGVTAASRGVAAELLIAVPIALVLTALVVPDERAGTARAAAGRPDAPPVPAGP